MLCGWQRSGCWCNGPMLDVECMTWRLSWLGQSWSVLSWSTFYQHPPAWCLYKHIKERHPRVLSTRAKECFKALSVGKLVSSCRNVALLIKATCEMLKYLSTLAIAQDPAEQPTAELWSCLEIWPIDITAHTPHSAQNTMAATVENILYFVEYLMRVPDDY